MKNKPVLAFRRVRGQAFRPKVGKEVLMKKLSALLVVCFLAAGAAAQHRDSLPSDTVTEKRFVTTPADGSAAPFLLNTLTAELWRLSPETMEWVFLGRPRGANARRKGNYRLLPYKPGEIFVLNSDSGEMWWTDGKSWKNIEEPSTRRKTVPPKSYFDD